MFRARWFNSFKMQQTPPQDASLKRLQSSSASRSNEATEVREHASRLNNALKELEDENMHLRSDVRRAKIEGSRSKEALLQAGNQLSTVISENNDLRIDVSRLKRLKQVGRLCLSRHASQAPWAFNRTEIFFFFNFIFPFFHFFPFLV